MQRLLLLPLVINRTEKQHNLHIQHSSPVSAEDLSTKPKDLKRPLTSNVAVITTTRAVSSSEELDDGLRKQNTFKIILLTFYATSIVFAAPFQQNVPPNRIILDDDLLLFSLSRSRLRQYVVAIKLLLYCAYGESFVILESPLNHNFTYTSAFR